MKKFLLLVVVLMVSPYLFARKKGQGSPLRIMSELVESSVIVFLRKRLFFDFLKSIFIP